MDCRNRQGQILIETLMILFLFLTMILVFEKKIKPQLLNKATKRWERVKP
jgi:hypothetical protein